MVPRYLVICYLLIVFCLAAFSKRTAYQSLSIISFSLRYSRLLLRFFRTQDSTTWCNRRDTRDAVQYRRRFYTETTHAKKHQAGRQADWSHRSLGCEQSDTLFSQKPTAAIVLCVASFVHHNFLCSFFASSFSPSQFLPAILRFFKHRHTPSSTLASSFLSLKRQPRCVDAVALDCCFRCIVQSVKLSGPSSCSLSRCLHYSD